jgi:hypothetical protein
MQFYVIIIMRARICMRIEKTVQHHLRICSNEIKIMKIVFRFPYV